MLDPVGIADSRDSVSAHEGGGDVDALAQLRARRPGSGTQRADQGARVDGRLVRGMHGRRAARAQARLQLAGLGGPQP